MPYLKVLLAPDEEQAIIDLSIREKRYPPQQIAYILRRWLERKKLLPPANTRPEGDHEPN